MTAKPTTPYSIRRNPINGAPRFSVEVRTESGWSFLGSRTTTRAARDLLVMHADYPTRAAYRGLPLRVRDIIDGDIVAARG